MTNTIDAEKILHLAQGFMESRILLSAAELNLFTLLAQTPLSAAEIAEKTGCSKHALSMLLDALAAMELLIKRDDTFHCESDVSRFLSEGSADSILPMILHVSSLWRRWGRLTDIVKGAGTEKDSFDFARNEEELRAFIGAMHVIGAPLAKRIVAAVNPGNAKSLLDIGSGSGTYTIAFLAAVPDMRATLFDLPEVIKMARERISREGLLSRTSFIPGDFHNDELPGRHDLILISAIIHSNSPEENLNLYRKAFRALNHGGRILIRDHVMEPDRTHPFAGAIFAINMLAGTSGGGTYTYEEIEKGLSRTGFDKIKLLRQGEHMDAVVEAYKGSG
jgi:SAM-dependent methyltransferase